MAVSAEALSHLYSASKTYPETGLLICDIREKCAWILNNFGEKYPLDEVTKLCLVVRLLNPNYLGLNLSDLTTPLFARVPVKTEYFERPVLGDLTVISDIAKPEHRATNFNLEVARFGKEYLHGRITHTRGRDCLKIYPEDWLENFAFGPHEADLEEYQRVQGMLTSAVNYLKPSRQTYH